MDTKFKIGDLVQDIHSRYVGYIYTIRSTMLTNIENKTTTENIYYLRGHEKFTFQEENLRKINIASIE